MGDGTKRLPQDFAVWREGTELVDEDDSWGHKLHLTRPNIYGPNEEPISGEVVASYKWGSKWKLK